MSRNTHDADLDHHGQIPTDKAKLAADTDSYSAGDDLQTVIADLDTRAGGGGGGGGGSLHLTEDTTTFSTNGIKFTGDFEYLGAWGNTADTYATVDIFASGDDTDASIDIYVQSHAGSSNAEITLDDGGSIAMFTNDTSANEGSLGMDASGFNVDVVDGGSGADAFLGLEPAAKLIDIYSDDGAGSNAELYVDGGQGLLRMISSKGFLLPTLSSAPGSPVESQSYYDTTLHKSRTWDGSAWQNWW